MVAAVSTCIGLVLLLLAVSAPQRNLLQERLAGDDDEPGHLTAAGEEWEGLSIRSRVVAPIVRGFTGIIGRLVPAAQLRAIDTQLSNLGNPWGLTGGTFISLLVASGTGGLIFGILAVVLGGLTDTLATMTPFVTMISGVMYPRIKLQRLAKARKKEIGVALPDMLDLLTICVEAGLTIDGGIREIAFAYDNALSQEFRRLINEVNLGRPRDEAMMAMATRSGVEELQSMVSSIIQSQKLGASIAATLRVQSEEVRRMRRQKAEETAAKAPVKMLLPMVGCIFPTIFMVLLGPAIIMVTTGSK